MKQRDRRVCTAPNFKFEDSVLAIEGSVHHTEKSDFTGTWKVSATGSGSCPPSSSMQQAVCYKLFTKQHVQHTM